MYGWLLLNHWDITSFLMTYEYIKQDHLLLFLIVFMLVIYFECKSYSFDSIMQNKKFKFQLLTWKIINKFRQVRAKFQPNEHFIYFAVYGDQSFRNSFRCWQNFMLKNVGLTLYIYHLNHKLITIIFGILLFYTIYLY